MTSPNIINPDSFILKQLEGKWQQIALLLLWKLKGTSKVIVTAEDIQSLTKAFAPGNPVFMIRGHEDSMEYQIINEERAFELAKEDAEKGGHA